MRFGGDFCFLLSGFFIKKNTAGIKGVCLKSATILIDGSFYSISCKLQPPSKLDFLLSYKKYRMSFLVYFPPSATPWAPSPRRTSRPPSSLCPYPTWSGGR